MEQWKEYMQPSLMVLIPVLNLIGSWLKKAQWFQDKYIPITLGAIAIILALINVLSQCPVHTFQQFLSAVFTSVTQGVFCAGTSVYAHQITKQTKKPPQV